MPDDVWVFALQNFVRVFAGNLDGLNERRQWQLAVVADRLCERLLHLHAKDFDWANVHHFPDPIFVDWLPELFETYNEVEQLPPLPFPQPRQVQLESIAELVEQKVSPHQIAKIYSWYDDAGRPDLSRVKRAIADPTSEPPIIITQGPEQDGYPTSRPSCLNLRMLSEKST